MKKILILCLITVMMCGCEFNSDPYNDATIYSTIYPVTYLMEKLYGDFSTIDSIYPEDVSALDYDLTDKQLDNYADESDIFVYLGLTDEKTIAKYFVNENKDVLLVDATYSLAISSSVEELWLSPNNYLMLAKNIRDNLFESLENQYTLEVVEEKYNELSEILSLMDAELRQAGSAATENGNNLLLVTSDAFMFLENYGFSVVSLSDENNQTDDAISAIKSNLKNDRYLALINEYGDSDEDINSYIDDYDISVIEMGTYYSSYSEDDYIEVLNNFIYSLEIVVND